MILSTLNVSTTLAPHAACDDHAAPPAECQSTLGANANDVASPTKLYAAKFNHFGTDKMHV